MTLVMVSGMTHQYGTSIFAIDHINGRFNILSQDGVQPLDLYGWVDDTDPLHSESGSTLHHSQLLMPLASSTPFLMALTSTQESPALPPNTFDNGSK